MATFITLYGMEMNWDRRSEICTQRALLQRVIYGGDLDTISQLLRYVELDDPIDSFGRTPLHYAVECGQTDIVCLLLDHGAHAHSQAASGDTPFHAASRLGDVEVVKALLARGAYAWFAGACGKTPLHVAAESGTSAVVKELLYNGADVTARDAGGMRPLHLAMRHEFGDTKVGEILLTLGGTGQLSLENDSGDLPLDVALYCRRWNCVDFLLWNGAPSNTDLRALTCELGEEDQIVRLLRSYGRVRGDLS